MYSPHTAVDAAPRGMADWLGEMVVGEFPGSQMTLNPHANPPPGFEGAGAGRLLSLEKPQSVQTLAEQLARNIFGDSSPRGLSLALPQGQKAGTMNISTVAVCPGSGSSILLKNGLPVAQLLVTGELSHHEALAATEAGSAVITLFHSNSERGYVRGSMCEILKRKLPNEWVKVQEEMGREKASRGGYSSNIEVILANDNVLVEVSETDRDPYQIKYWSGDTEMGL